MESATNTSKQLLGRRGGRPLVIASVVALAAFSLDAAHQATAEPVTPDVATPTNLGTLTNFYRGTQLQSIFPSQGLIDIPPYLLATDIDVRYSKKPGFSREIPFTDKITFTRFVGGYSEQVLKNFGLWNDDLGNQSDDYVTRSNTGTLVFHPELIKDRLGPYIQAGYQLRDMTLSLSNVPWALARNGGLAGVWGQMNPPASLQEWSDTVGHLANDITSFFPMKDPPQFKLGAEYDATDSFNGTFQDYFAYFDATRAAVTAKFPGATLTPGEFTGQGVCRYTPASQCVYDTHDLVSHAAAEGISFADLPRSLHLSQFIGSAMPSVAVNRAANSYKPLPGIAAEVHQFGLLDQPFAGNGSLGSDVGARQAAWEFEALMGLQRTLKPQLVNHWDVFESIANNQVNLLNGSGFVRLLLDRYSGSQMTELPVVADTTLHSEVLAVLFQSSQRTAIVVGAFTPGNLPATVHADIDLSGTGLPASSFRGRAKILRYGEQANVFLQIRNDLQARGNLRSEFAQCRYCVADPLYMGNSGDETRQMVLDNKRKYEELIKQNLRFKASAADRSLRTLADHLQLDMSGNEIVVIEVLNNMAGKFR